MLLESRGRFLTRRWPLGHLTEEWPTIRPELERAIRISPVTYWDRHSNDGPG
jgi:hypothetical protein